MLKGQQGHIVKGRTVGEGVQVAKAGGDHFGRRIPCLLTQHVRDAVHAIFLIRTAGFRETVCVEQQRVTGFQAELLCREVHVAEHAQWQSRGFNPHDFSAPEYDHRPMTRVMDFHLARWRGLPANQRGIVPGKRALTKNAVRLNHDLVQRERHPSQAAKQCVKLRHQHGCRDTFAGDIAQHKEKPPIGWNQVAVIAAYGSVWRVTVTGCPTVSAQIGGRQEMVLNLRGEFEITLQRIPLRVGQMVETEAEQWIGQQPVILNRFVACLA